jgi:hypothetical protein
MLGQEAILQITFTAMLEIEFPECNVIAVMPESTKGVISPIMTAMGYRSGVPDVIITLPNRCIYVELKAPKKGTLKNLRHKQAEYRKKLIGKGFEYKLADSSNDFYEIMEELYKHLDKAPSKRVFGQGDDFKMATFWECMDDFITLALRHRKEIKTLIGCKELVLSDGTMWLMR